MVEARFIEGFDLTHFIPVLPSSIQVELKLRLMASNFNQSIVVLNQVVSLFIFVIAYNLDYLLLNSLPLVSFTSIFFAAINENISICNTVVKLGINIQSNFFFSSSSSFQLSGLKTETITNNYSIILKRIMHNLTLTNLMMQSHSVQVLCGSCSHK